jgi:hypothetical protein
MGAFGPRLGVYFGVPCRSYLARPAQAPRFAITRLVGSTNMPNQACRIPPEPSYLVTLYLIPAWLEIGCSGQAPLGHQCSAGSIGIESLATALVVTPRGPLDCLSFYIRQRFFDELAALLGAARSHTLHCVHGTPDRILRDIGMALLPLLDKPEQVAPEFLDHIARATCLHLVHTYGNVSRNETS